MKYFLALVTIFILFSCGKDVDKELPKISFIQPAGNDTFKISLLDSLPISFKLTDNSNLQQYSFVIKDSLENKIKVGASFIEGTSHEYKGHEYIFDKDTVTKLWIYITTYDRAYNARTESRTFYVQP